MNNDCNTARFTLSTDGDGRHWEHFWLGERYIFSNQIPNRQSFSTTRPGDIIADRGLCAWVAPSAAPVAATTATLPSGDGGAGGLLLLLAILGSGAWAWVTRQQTADHGDTYHPMADVPPLPLPPGLATQGNSTHGIPRVEPLEFARNSIEFERNSQEGHANSQTALDANSLGIPGVVADSQEWPPKSMGAPYDPLQPEQAGEFETYCKRLEEDGLAPRGNDVIRVVWGATPGRSAAYDAARRRRDAFAKRLDYYKFEGA